MLRGNRFRWNAVELYIAFSLKGTLSRLVKEVVLMMKAFAAVLGLSFLVAVPASAANWGNISGRYEGRELGHRIKADVQQVGKRFSGVARVYGPLGARRLKFRFNGVFENGKLFVSHKEGHYFTGRMNGRGQIVGTVVVRGGQRIRLRMSRRR